MRKYQRVLGSVAAPALLLLLLLTLVLPFSQTQMQSARDKAADELPLDVGGIVDSPGRENDLARFAISEHNNKTNALLEFEKVVKLKEQVVGGMLYYITIQVNEGGAKKMYEAEVWERPWEDFKKLVEFRRAEGVSASA